MSHAKKIGMRWSVKEPTMNGTPRICLGKLPTLQIRSAWTKEILNGMTTVKRNSKGSRLSAMEQMNKTWDTTSGIIPVIGSTPLTSLESREKMAIIPLLARCTFLSWARSTVLSWAKESASNPQPLVEPLPLLVPHLSLPASLSPWPWKRCARNRRARSTMTSEVPFESYYLC